MNNNNSQGSFSHEGAFYFYEVTMGITFNLDSKTLDALQHFLHDNRKIQNQQEAVEFLLKKSLQDLGYLTRDPGIGTSPDRLNSSNDD